MVQTDKVHLACGMLSVLTTKPVATRSRFTNSRSGLKWSGLKAWHETNLALIFYWGGGAGIVASAYFVYQARLSKCMNGVTVDCRNNICAFRVNLSVTLSSLDL